MTVADLEVAYEHAEQCDRSARNAGCGTLEVGEYERIAKSLWGQLWAKRFVAKHSLPRGG